MNTDTDLQRQVNRVFADAAPSGYPDELLDRVLSTTSRTRPRSTWLANIKEPPMRIPARVVVGSPMLRLASILALTLALILAVAGVVVAGASLLPKQPLPDPYGPARNGSLVYDKDGDIFRANADGTNPVAIVTGDTKDRYPWFSHDGTRLAFGRGEDDDLALIVANPDGSSPRQLATGVGWVDFMPADDQMVGTRTVDGRTVLSMIDVNGGAIKDLDVGDIELRGWVMPRPPDGQELVFTGRPHPGKKDLGIYGIKPDGTGLRTIGAISTTESGDGGVPPTNQISFQDPVISPDGKTIAYWNWEPSPVDSTCCGAYLHLRDLTSGQEIPNPYDTSEGGLLLHYSPDGKMVVFEGHEKRPGSPEQLFYGSADGSQPAVPIGPPYIYSDRLGNDFSPDGTKVLLSMIGYTIEIDVATGEMDHSLNGIPSTPGWQRLAP